MKKLLFLLWVLAGAATLPACSKDEIPDPNAPTGLPALPDPEDVCSCMDDEVFKRYCLGFDTNHDGKLSRDEAAAATTISLSDTNVKSLAGIGYFPNLEKLGCSNCKQLRTVDLSNNRKITSIGAQYFLECSKLTSIILPKSVVSIKCEAFLGCSNLKSIEIPAQVSEIGDYAFTSCSSLESITIPDKVTKIEAGVFELCRNLTNIVIPDGVTSIGSNAFKDCTDLEHITLGRNTTWIQHHAFAGCSSLKRIEISDKVVALASYAFLDCSSLTDIRIGKGITSIESHTFAGCSTLKSIELPENIAQIGHYAFLNCSDLTTIYCRSTTPPALGARVFSSVNEAAKIYVPATSVEAYKTAEGWSEYASRIEGYKK